MAKTMTIKYDGQEYTLEYTRNSIKKMEAKGFEIDKVASKPMTMLPALFEGAFLAHHSNVAPSKISEIFADLPDKEKLVDMLAVMYNEPFETLLETPKESKGNASWGTNW